MFRGFHWASHRQRRCVNERKCRKFRDLVKECGGSESHADSDGRFLCLTFSFSRYLTFFSSQSRQVRRLRTSKRYFAILSFVCVIARCVCRDGQAAMLILIFFPQEYGFFVYSQWGKNYLSALSILGKIKANGFSHLPLLLSFLTPSLLPLSQILV